MAALVSTGCLLCDFLIIFAGALLALYVYFLHAYEYWKKRGVPYLEPTVPLGNNPFFFSKSPTFAGEAPRWYNELKKRGHKFGGVYWFLRSVLVLVDPDYIRDVLSQDFEYFIDRDFYCNKHDPQTMHLVNIKNPNWKPLRQKFTPTFTSGKMKMMFSSILNCSDSMIEYLDRERTEDINIREVLASFTLQVIGSSAFGIDCNSFDKQGEFRKQGRAILHMTFWQYFKGLCMRTFPKLCEKVGVTLGQAGEKKFFAKLVKETLEYREKNNVKRPDFLQILIDMNNESKNSERPFSYDEIVANTRMFFIAGFHTSSTLMTFTLYELAKNPEIQEKARKEITDVLKKHKGEITYDAIQELSYLTQVFDETMRIYPPAIVLSRICTKDYQLKNTNITIEKGTPVVITTLGLGRDPDIFPEPMKFDPDRFSHEEVAKRHNYVHIPFGEGPRNCIGQRFGLMQAKIGLVRLLTSFKWTISPKTKMPLALDERIFLLKEKQTLYLKVEKV